MKTKAPDNVLGVSGLGSLQHLLTSKNYKLLKKNEKLELAITNLISAAQAVIEAIDVQECDPIMALKSAVDEARSALKMES